MKGKPPSEPGGVIREIEVSVEFFERKEFILLLAFSDVFPKFCNFTNRLSRAMVEQKFFLHEATTFATVVAKTGS